MADTISTTLASVRYSIYDWLQVYCICAYVIIKFFATKLHLPTVEAIFTQIVQYLHLTTANQSWADVQTMYLWSENWYSILASHAS